MKTLIIAAVTGLVLAGTPGLVMAGGFGKGEQAQTGDQGASGQGVQGRDRAKDGAQSGDKQKKQDQTRDC